MYSVTMKDLAPLEELFDPAYPETLRDFATSIFMQLLDEAQRPAPEPYKGPVMAGVALRIANRLGDEFGGRSLYFAKGKRFHQELRNREILTLFDGRTWTYKTLGMRFGLSDMQVRNIVDYDREKAKEARKQKEASAA